MPDAFDIGIASLTLFAHQPVVTFRCGHAVLPNCAGEWAWKGDPFVIHCVVCINARAESGRVVRNA